MHSFRLATTLRHGLDALTSLSELDGCRVLIVTDSFMATTDLMAGVRRALGGAQVEVFDQVPPNPDTDVISDGMRVFGSFLPAAIVALGGGSPIDAAKTIRKLALEQGHDLAAGFYVIPTTSGSGSEVTSYAVITDTHNHAKLPLTSPDMIPDVAILDPEAVRTAPQTHCRRRHGRGEPQHRGLCRPGLQRLFRCFGREVTAHDLRIPAPHLP